MVVEASPAATAEAAVAATSPRPPPSPPHRSLRGTAQRSQRERLGRRSGREPTDSGLQCALRELRAAVVDSAHAHRAIGTQTERNVGGSLRFKLVLTLYMGGGVALFRGVRAFAFRLPTPISRFLHPPPSFSCFLSTVFTAESLSPTPAGRLLPSPFLN